MLFQRRLARTQFHPSYRFLFAVVTLFLASNVWAGAASWSTTNIQFLSGSGYEVGPDSRGIMTVEHANAWKYGDNFFFLDVTNPDRTGTGYYAEFSPRLSLYKMAGSELSSEGLVKDVLLSFTGEFSAGRSYLYGAAVDLNLPKFAFFKVNWYIRDEVSSDDEGQQITLAWLLPFKTGTLAWSFEGFFDYAYGLDNKEDNIVSAPRLLADIGGLWGSPGVLQAGVEYQIWRNKFGIDGIDEDVPQLMLKWIW